MTTPNHVVVVRAAALAARRVLHLTRAEHRAVCEAAIVAAERWAAEPTETHADLAWGAQWALCRGQCGGYGAWAWAAGAARSAAQGAAVPILARVAGEAAVVAAGLAAGAAKVAGEAGELAAQRADLDRLLRELE